jgi:putative transposase
LYFNNGVQKSQFKCKVCSGTFTKEVIPKKSEYFCPYCHYALFRWKEEANVTIYKCGNHECQCYRDNYKKLNEKELLLYQKNPGHFTLHYIFRDYKYEIPDITHSSPAHPVLNLNKIYNSQTILGLILTFFVSFSISARKTALILRWVYQINISYQTVLNYAHTASFYCHRFNMRNKGQIDDTQAADETYIKVNGKHKYIWFYLSTKKRAITSYHYADNRGVLPAITSMNEAFRTAKGDQTISVFTDGNPSYTAAVQYLNAKNKPGDSIEHHKVVGLQNLDEESEKYRAFKQLIERLNRTYKGHVKQAYGFSSPNGAIALTTLFVTYYNFLRPHSALKHKVPVHLDFLDGIQTIQAKWIKIISKAYG